MDLLEVIRQGLQKLILDIIAASEAAGQRASGQTYENIVEETERVGQLVTGTVYAPNYFYTLIRGRGPGKTPANFAQIIMEWAQVKGLSFASPEELERFGNAVAWKIRRDGSQLYVNHLYVDIIDTPIKMFEEYLEQQMDTIMDTVITAAWNADNFEGHGFIA